MATRIHLSALTSFTHHGRQIQPGATFYATPIEAAALRYQQRADFLTAAGRPAPKPVATTGAAATAEEDEEADGKASRRGKRHYRRRDLEAER